MILIYFVSLLRKSQPCNFTVLYHYCSAKVNRIILEEVTAISLEKTSFLNCWVWGLQTADLFKLRILDAQHTRRLTVRKSENQAYQNPGNRETERW